MEAILFAIESAGCVLIPSDARIVKGKMARLVLNEPCMLHKYCACFCVIKICSNVQSRVALCVPHLTLLLRK
eukprot:XP_001705750.1 Hypothetical protein GL50803_103430 [Giardia lamblia ATCC 50803]